MVTATRQTEREVERSNISRRTYEQEIRHVYKYCILPHKVLGLDLIIPVLCIA